MKMQWRKFIATAIIITGTAMALHAATYKSVAVNTDEGVIMLISIENNTTVSVANGRHVWTSDKGTIEMPSADVRNWTFSTQAGTAEWAGVTDIVTDETGITRTGNIIQITNLPENSRVSVFDMQGRTVKSLSCSGCCTLSLAHLPKGVYIVRVNSRSIKISLNQ